jgi:hypothetical protein
VQPATVRDERRLPQRRSGTAASHNTPNEAVATPEQTRMAGRTATGFTATGARSSLPAMRDLVCVCVTRDAFYRVCWADQPGKKENARARRRRGVRRHEAVTVRDSFCHRAAIDLPRGEAVEPVACGRFSEKPVSPDKRTTRRKRTLSCPERLSSTSDRPPTVPTAAAGTPVEAQPAEVTGERSS